MARQSELPRSQSEVAGILGISQQNVAAGEKRAVRKLLEALGDADWSPVETFVFSPGRRNRRKMLQVRECV